MFVALASDPPRGCHLCATGWSTAGEEAEFSCVTATVGVVTGLTAIGSTVVDAEGAVDAPRRMIGERMATSSSVTIGLADGCGAARRTPSTCAKAVTAGFGWLIVGGCVGSTASKSRAVSGFAAGVLSATGVADVGGVVATEADWTAWGFNAAAMST